MNVGFIKRLFFYRNIEGMHDIRKELNYFNYFGITDEDCVEMLTLLKENEENITSFRETVYEKILYQINYYSTHFINEKGEFVKEHEQSNIASIRAYFSANLYYGIRLLAQEYWYIRNIVKTSFNPTITIPSFGKNKYTYTDYLDSIKYYYRDLLYFHMMTVDKNEESFLFYSEHDKHIDQSDFNLKAYKKIFMLIWMHTYARLATNIFEYGLEFESENPKKPHFRPNLLYPLDIALIDEDVDITEDVRKRREKDLRIRESYEIKGRIQKANEMAWNKITFYESLPYTIGDFTAVVNSMAEILEYQSTYELNDFVIILKNKVDATLKEKTLPVEVIKGFVVKMTISEADIAIQEDLHPFTRPLILFEKKGKQIIHADFEVIYFLTTLLEQYKFIEKDKIKDYYNIYFKEVNRIAIEETVSATRKFKVSWRSLRKHYFWLEGKKNYSKFFNLVDDIIYFSDTKMLVFIYWCNILPTTKSWCLYNEDFQLMVGKNSIARTIIKSKVSLLEEDLAGIKKMFKIHDNVSTKTVILFDGTLSLETRQVVEGRVVNLCPIKCIADFFVNDVNKK